MAVRLKYAGVLNRIILRIEHDWNKLIDNIINDAGEQETIYVLPTQNAMLDIRKVLKNRFKPEREF